MDTLRDLALKLKGEIASEDPLQILDFIKEWQRKSVCKFPKEWIDAIGEIFRSAKPPECPFCKSSGHSKYRYLNNKYKSISIQPRFMCRKCKKEFTLGGRNYTNRRSHRNRRHSLCNPTFEVLNHHSSVNLNLQETSLQNYWADQQKQSQFIEDELLVGDFSWSNFDLDLGFTSQDLQTTSVSQSSEDFETLVFSSSIGYGRGNRNEFNEDLLVDNFNCSNLDLDHLQSTLTDIPEPLEDFENLQLRFYDDGEMGNVLAKEKETDMEKIKRDYSLEELMPDYFDKIELALEDIGKEGQLDFTIDNKEEDISLNSLLEF